MSRILISPVKKFPGTVKLPEFYTLAQVSAWSDAVQDVMAATDDKGNIRRIKKYMIMLPAILACVEVWQIVGQPDNLTADNFVGTPTSAACDLLQWVDDEIRSIVNGDLEIPNASGPEPTPTQTEPAPSPAN